MCCQASLADTRAFAGPHEPGARARELPPLRCPAERRVAARTLAATPAAVEGSPSAADASAPLYRVRLRTLIAAHYAAHGLNHIQRWLASPAEAKLSPAEAKETLPAAPPPASHRREKSSSSSKYLRDPLSLPPALAEAEEVLPAAAWRVRPDLAPARALELLRAHVVAEQRLRQHALRLREVREAALQRRQQLALERAVSRRQRGADAEGSGPSQQAPASPQEETQLPPPPPPPHSPESEAFLNSPAQVCDACLVSVRGTLRGSSAEAALLLEGPSPVELLDARLAELARRGARDLSGAERLFRGAHFAPACALCCCARLTHQGLWWPQPSPSSVASPTGQPLRLRVSSSPERAHAPRRLARREPSTSRSPRPCARTARRVACACRSEARGGGLSEVRE